MRGAGTHEVHVHKDIKAVYEVKCAVKPLRKAWLLEEQELDFLSVWLQGSPESEGEEGVSHGEMGTGAEMKTERARGGERSERAHALLEGESESVSG